MMFLFHVNLVIGILLILGFSYILWILACKESGAVRLGGQILAIAIKLMVLVMVITLLFFCQQKGGLIKKCCMMGKAQMMMGGEMKSGKDGMKMEKMMNGKVCPMNPETKQDKK